MTESQLPYYFNQGSEAQVESGAKISIRRATQRPGRFPHASMGMLVWLTVVWVLLWGEVTTGNILSGFILALVITSVAPLPAAPFDGRFRPWGLVRLVALFVWDILVASASIAWSVIVGRQPRGAVIRVQLRSHSDVFLTTTAGMTALVPGSVVVDAHRETGTLYVHVLHVEGGEKGLEKAHAAVLAQEERIVRAFGSHDQLMDAGFVPGSTPKAGRLPTPFAAPAGSEQTS